MSDPKVMAEPELLINGPWANIFFDTTIKGPGEFAQRLLAAGYNRNGPATYPLPVFLKLLDLARQHLWPDLPPREGYWQAGRQHLSSYFAGAIGKVQALAFPLLGPDRLIKALERHAPAVGTFLKAEAFKEADKRWRLTLHPLRGIPAEFIAGGLEFGLEKAKTPTRRIVVTYSAADDAADLLVTW